jgi:hypothetical protein
MASAAVMNIQPPVMNIQPPVMNIQPPVMNIQPPVMNIQPPTPVSHESRWWGVYAIPGGVAYPNYDFAVHMRFLRTNDPHYFPEVMEGGALDGNHYGVVRLPEDLVGNEGLVIGKQGKNLKTITAKSGVIAIWYDSSVREFQIWSGNSRYTAHSEPSLPGRFAETGEVVTADGMDTDSLGYEMILDAKTFLFDLITNARRIVAKNKAASAGFPRLT